MRYAERQDGRASDVFIVVLAAFAIVAPWYNGAEIQPAGAVVAQFIGAAIGCIALWALARPGSLEAGSINALLGVSLVIAPFFTRSVPVESLECRLIGAAVTVLAVLPLTRLGRRSR